MLTVILTSLAHPVRSTPSRGGRTTKIHALSDGCGRPVVLALTPGHAADISLAAHLIDAMPPSARLIGDKGYDANHFRDSLQDRGTEPVIPSRTSRKQPLPFDALTYKNRNLIERMFGRLKDFRRVATRYDKLARNYLAAVAIAAVLIWWIN